MIDRDLQLKREIAANIKRLMKLNGIKSQIRLSEISGISKSTLSDYLTTRTLINPGNVEKLATALNVAKSEIDPSFAPSKGVETIAAHLDDDLTEDELEDIKRYIDFIKSQRK